MERQPQPQEHNPDSLARLIESHWREFRPKMVADMVQQGNLQALVTSEAQLAHEKVRFLMGQGMKYPQAWEIVQSEILLPSEEDVPALGLGTGAR